MKKSTESEKVHRALFMGGSAWRSQRSGALNEVLKDADVWQHCMYDPLGAVEPKERERYAALKKEFGIG